MVGKKTDQCFSEMQQHVSCFVHNSKMFSSMFKGLKKQENTHIWKKVHKTIKGHNMIELATCWNKTPNK